MSLGTFLTFSWQTASHYSRYHTRITRSKRSDRQETTQRKPVSRKKRNKTDREARVG